MQFGIFTVGDVTPDQTTGRTPSEHVVHSASGVAAGLPNAKPGTPVAPPTANVMRPPSTVLPANCIVRPSHAVGSCWIVAPAVVPS